MPVIIPPKKEMIGSDEKICNESKNPMLVLDLVISVMERLSFIDFHRARCVSSVWYSASRSCVGRTNPWLVLFPDEPVESNNGSCKLFDPSDHKSYTVRDLGFGFARSRCLSNYGSWFLMLDHRTEFYLLNLFTRERIPLPSPESMESTDGSQLKFKRISDSDFTFTAFYYKDNERFSSEKNIRIEVNNAVLWVDERSRDYLVVWNFNCLFAYHKKRDENNDNSWRVFQSLKNKHCVDMVFKESKLYVLGPSRNITVYDFSHGDSPMECASFSLPDCYHAEYFYNLAVTLSGQVLIISSMGRDFLNLYKMDPKSSKWSILKSLGEEALLLDQGITVAAKDGVLKNCIYYSNDQFHRRSNGFTLCSGDDNGICVSNIRTKNVVQVFDHLTASLKDARWFFPSFGGKRLL